MAGGEIFLYSLSDSMAKDPKPVTSTPHKPIFAPKRALNVITIGREESMTFQASKLKTGDTGEDSDCRSIKH